MKHLLLLALILGSVPVAAHGVLDCKVYNGYKQFDIIGYFPLRFTLHKTQQDKVEISGWFQDSRPNPDGFDSVGPFCLSSKINMGYTFSTKGETVKFQTGWDYYEHHLTLYSNNSLKWGGNLTLEEDTRFRVACVTRKVDTLPAPCTRGLPRK